MSNEPQDQKVRWQKLITSTAVAPHKIMPNNIGTNSWFICHKPKPMARLRLFCFPYAGGGASMFRTWADQLPSDVEIIGIQMPGVESRIMEPPITNLPTLVQRVAHVINPKLNKPFAFFGHSLGALIGFELTHKLSQEHGFEPVHLFVAGSRAPQIPDPYRPMHDLPESAFLEALHRRYYGFQEEILSNPDILQVLLPGLKAYLKMYESYEHVNNHPLDCPITVFGGLQDNTVSRGELEAWRHQTNRSFSLQMIPGSHFFINSEQEHFLQTLSSELTRILSQLATDGFIHKK